MYFYLSIRSTIYTTCVTYRINVLSQVRRDACARPPPVAAPRRRNNCWSRNWRCSTNSRSVSSWPLSAPYSRRGPPSLTVSDRYPPSADTLTLLAIRERGWRSVKPNAQRSLKLSPPPPATHTAQTLYFRSISHLVALLNQTVICSYLWFTSLEMFNK